MHVGSRQGGGELRMGGWVGDRNDTFISVVILTNDYIDIFVAYIILCCGQLLIVYVINLNSG